MFWTILYAATIASTCAAPTYFTVWLNDGNRLRSFLPQLLDQNVRFGDVLIVDESVRPFVGGHGNVLLDDDVFRSARSNNPTMEGTLGELYGYYNRLKPTMPAAASDILRFVSFIGLEGDEFVYHDVDVRLGQTYTGELAKPFASALIGTDNKNHLSMNWLMRALFQPTPEINLERWNWNTDLIAARPDDCLILLTSYLKLTTKYFEYMTTTRLSGPDGTLHPVMDIVTGKVTYPPGSKFTLPSSEDARVFNNDEGVEEMRRSGVELRKLKATIVWGSSIHLLEMLLHGTFMSEYHIPVDVDPEDPYALAERVFKLSVLELRGHTRGIFSFFLDHVADPIEFGAVSRKNNADWFGEGVQEIVDVPVLDCEALKNSAMAMENDDDDAQTDSDDYESYDEDDMPLAAVEARVESLAIDMDGPRQSVGSILPAFDCLSLRRRRSTCPREDESNYDISNEGTVLYRNRWLVHATSRYLIVHDPASFKSYKYTVRPAILSYVVRLNERIVSRLERFLKLPSGRFASNEMNFKYRRLLASSQQPARLRRYMASMTPLGKSMSNAARRFTRASFGIGYMTSIAFNTQFLSSAVSGKNMDLAHKIALGTIGTVGMAEIAYVTSNRLTMMITSAPIRYAAAFTNVFRAFGVATAVYFGVQSSIELADNPSNVESWWWLSRSVTVFTPLNKYFIPVDITLIVTRQIVHASWQLSYQQNRLILNYGERDHYHAMSFFGIETARTLDIHNNAAFRTAVVNPTVSHLAGVLRDGDAKAVVGYPATTLCKTTGRVVFNNANEYETNVDGVDDYELHTELDTLATQRMETCLNDELALCGERTDGFWTWITSLFAKTSRVRHRGADLGVGCTLLDGTIPTGSACSRVDAIRADIANRVRVLIADRRLSGSNPHSLPLIHPREYDFRYVSVSNGSIASTTVDGCAEMLRWADVVAPYVLVRPSRGERIDYIGVPIGAAVFQTRRDHSARVYMYKLNKNDRIDTITVRGSLDRDNEFVVVETDDVWDVYGGNRSNKLVLQAGSNVIVGRDVTVVDDRVTVHDVTVVDARAMANLTISVEGTTDTHVLVGNDSVVVASAGSVVKRLYLSDGTTFTASSSSQSTVHVNGNDNLLILRPASTVVATVNGSADLEVESTAILHLMVRYMSRGVVNADAMAQVYVYGLGDDWNITDSTIGGIVVNDALRLNSLKTVFFFADYYLIWRQYGPSAVVLEDVARLEKVPDFLRDVDVFVKHGDRVLYYIGNTSELTAKEDVKEYMISGNVSLTIPYQSRKRLDFYGEGHVDVGGMQSCGRRESCGLFAHISCDRPDDIVEVCRAA